MRKFAAALLSAGALAAAAALPAFAGMDFCLSDPGVRVGHSEVKVGLYTADGAVFRSIDGGLLVELHGARREQLHTVERKWQAHFPAEIKVEKDLPPVADSSNSLPLVIDATVPAAAGSGRFSIRVTLPDGSVRTVSAPVNSRAELTVNVPQ